MNATKKKTRPVLNVRKGSVLERLLAVLTEPERAELLRVAAHGTWTDLKLWFDAHGISAGDSSISRSRDKLQLAAEGLLKRNQAIGVIRQHAAEAGVTLTQAALEEGAIAVADILDGAVDPTSEAGQKLLLSGLGVLTGVRNSEVAADRVKASREIRALAERRLKILEDREAKTKAVVADTKLTPAEKEREMKRLLGVAG